MQRGSRVHGSPVAAVKGGSEASTCLGRRACLVARRAPTAKCRVSTPLLQCTAKGQTVKLQETENCYPMEDHFAESEISHPTISCVSVYRRAAVLGIGTESKHAGSHTSLGSPSLDRWPLRRWPFSGTLLSRGKKGYRTWSRH